jgi:hypothetical protein
MKRITEEFIGLLKLVINQEGAWDRSTSWGMFATLEEALKCAGNGRTWGRG